MSREPESSDYGPAERHQHDVVAEEETAQAGIKRARVLGFIEKIWNGGTIDCEQYAAAQSYRADFEAAHLGPKYAMSGTERIDKGYTDTGGRAEAARNAISKLESRVGMMGGWVLWHVVGCDLNPAEAASRFRNNGLTIDRHKVTGMLILALDVAAHFYNHKKMTCRPVTGSVRVWRG